MSSRRNFLKGLGAFAGLCLLGGRNWALPGANDDFDMLVIGDSLVSGQGLLEKDKFSELTRRWLAADVFQDKRRVVFTNKSHSGARLFLGEKERRALESAGKDPTEFYHQEINFSFPSIKTQIDLAASEYSVLGKTPGDVDLVLMTGSLTDINASYVLNGLKKYRPLRQKIENHCNEGMFRFLRYATGVFPNALFTVVGYFPMVSKKSSSGEIYNSILEVYDFPGAAKPMLNNLFTKQFFKILHGRITKRSKIWFEESTIELKKAVKRVNEHTGKMSAVFVESPIPTNRSFGTKDSLLWGMGKKGRSEDDLYDVRQVECKAAFKKVRDVDLRFRRRMCELSGIGHPNPEGSLMYAKAIQNTLSKLKSRW